MTWRRRTILVSALLCALTLCAFWPIFHNAFIEWDDSTYVSENPHVLSGLTWPNLGWAFGTSYAANWHPVTWLSHMADCQLYGLRPWGHHLTSLLLHSANAVLLFLLMQRWTGAQWRSAMVAALFALHPLHVESVAWVAERKDVLSAFFFLLTLAAYGAYAVRAKGAGVRDGKLAIRNPETENLTNIEPKSGIRSELPGPQHDLRAIFSLASRLSSTFYYILALVLFALGLMSKPMVVTLPFVLLLLDLWPLRRCAWSARSNQLTLAYSAPMSTPPLRLALEKIPFLCLAAFACLMTLAAQAQGHAVKSGLAFGPRVANALVSYMKYLGKTFYPANLAVFYPHPNIGRLVPGFSAPPAQGQHWLDWPVVAVVVLLGLISLLSLLQLGRRPWLAAGWFWFVGTLVPVIGLVQVGRQALADRYTYIPLIGIFICLVWCAADMLAGHRLGRKILMAGAVAVLAGCLAVTRHQVGFWRNASTVFGHALDVTVNNSVAHWYLGKELGEKRHYDLAIAHFQAAIAAEPAYADAYVSLAVVLAAEGRVDEAIEQCRTAVRVKPWYDWAHNQLGELLWAAGSRQEALVEFEQALRLNPDNARAHYNLGAAFSSLGKTAQAADEFAAAVRLKPDYAEALRDLGWALAGLGRMREAQARFRDTVRLCPTNANLHVNLGSLLWVTGQTNEARACFSNALRLDPSLVRKFLEEGDALSAKGQAESAVTRLNIARWLDPENAETQAKLAWLLATAPQAGARNGKEAVRLAQQAMMASGSPNARFWAALDAAYAEAGEFPEAIAAAEKTRDLALAAGQEELARAAEKRLTLYRKGEAYHQTP